jgi:hypothetical protein
MTQPPVTDGMPSCAATSPDFVDNGVCDGSAGSAPMSGDTSGTLPTADNSAAPINEGRDMDVGSHRAAPIGDAEESGGPAAQHMNREINDGGFGANSGADAEKARIAAEAQAAEQAAQAEAARLAKEEADRLAKEEADRLAAEAAAQAEADRLAAEAAAQAEADRLAAEAAAQAEADRLAAEAAAQAEAQAAAEAETGLCIAKLQAIDEQTFRDCKSPKAKVDTARGGVCYNGFMWHDNYGPNRRAEVAGCVATYAEIKKEKWELFKKHDTINARCLTALQELVNETTSFNDKEEYGCKQSNNNNINKFGSCGSGQEVTNANGYLLFGYKQGELFMGYDNWKRNEKRNGVEAMQQWVDKKWFAKTDVTQVNEAWRAVKDECGM